jgi:hypothetical protein
MYENLRQRCLIYVSGVNQNWDVMTNFIFKKINPNFHKNPSGGEDLLHKDRLTDMAKLTVAFHNCFTNGPTSKLRQEGRRKEKQQRTIAYELRYFAH